MNLEDSDTVFSSSGLLNDDLEKPNPKLEQGAFFTEMRLANLLNLMNCFQPDDQKLNEFDLDAKITYQMNIKNCSEDEAIAHFKNYFSNMKQKPKNT